MRRDIPQKDWVNFFVDFNRENRAKIVSVQLDENGSSRKLAEKLPLWTLDVSSKDTENTIVQIILGENSQVSHFIDKVNKVELEETSSNNPREIIVKSKLGVTAEIHFHSLDEA